MIKKMRLGPEHKIFTNARFKCALKNEQTMRSNYMVIKFLLNDNHEFWEDVKVVNNKKVSSS